MDNYLAETKQPSYRRFQLWEGLYKQLWTSSDYFTNLPRDFRKKLDDLFSFTSLDLVKTIKSNDGNTIKFLYYTPDASPIETVLMRYNRRNSLCLSTQSGCVLKCSFCATGQMGFFRDLSAGEIVEQVIHGAIYLKQQEERLTNIIFMGMGEPLLNLDSTLKAVEILNHGDGFNMGERRFTLSTVGIVPGIYQLCQENKQLNLAVSLHAANNELRSLLMPINNKYPLETLIKACREYMRFTHRRLTFEWALIDGVNDTPDDAHQLADLVHGLLCHINLIPLNPTQLYPKKASNRPKIDAFHQIIRSSGLPCTIRVRRGIDIQAGCGQLAASMK